MDLWVFEFFFLFICLCKSAWLYLQHLSGCIVATRGRGQHLTAQAHAGRRGAPVPLLPCGPGRVLLLPMERAGRGCLCRVCGSLREPHAPGPGQDVASGCRGAGRAGGGGAWPGIRLFPLCPQRCGGKRRTQAGRRWRAAGGARRTAAPCSPRWAPWRPSWRSSCRGSRRRPCRPRSCAPCGSRWRA